MKYIFAMLLCGCSIAGNAQGEALDLDSVYILSQQVVQSNQFLVTDPNIAATSSAERINYLPGVAVRSLGSGQINTLQYQGLRGAQINYTWNGVRVNNPQIGVGDLNEIPLNNLSSVELSSRDGGNTASTLNLKQDWQKRTRIDLQYAQGGGYLFNLHHNGLGIRVYEDDFNFRHSNFERNSVAQENTFAKNYSITYSSKRKKGIQLHSYATHQIINQHPSGGGFNVLDDRLKMTSLRQLLSYNHQKGEIRTGVLYDALDNNYRSQISAGQTVQALIGGTYNVTDKLDFEQDWRLIFSEHSEYREDLKGAIQLDNRLKYKTNINDKTTTELSGGHLFQENIGQVFFGHAALNWATTHGFWVWKIGRLGRLPNFDDLLWRNGGASQLAPETAWDFLLACDHVFKGQLIKIDIGYRHFDKYTLWLPNLGSQWSAQSISNISNVHAGIEWLSEAPKKSTYFQYGASVNFTSLKTTRRSNSRLRRNTQLPFTPQFLAQAQLNYTLRNFSIQSQLKYTSNQFSAFNALTSFDDFIVARLAFAYTHKSLGASFSIDNLTNTRIPVDFGLPSPLRRCRIAVYHRIK